MVELNRAVAVALAEGAERGLEIVDAIAGHPMLREYHLLPSVRGLLPSVRGDLLTRLENGPA